MEELTPEEKIILYRKRQQIKDRIKSWNDSVPEAFRGYDLDTLLEGRVNGNIPAAAVIDIRNWMKNPTPFLLLHGPSGLGKTLIGFLIAGEMLSRGVVGTARYIPATWMVFLTILTGRKVVRWRDQSTRSFFFSMTWEAVEWTCHRHGALVYGNSLTTVGPQGNTRSSPRTSLPQRWLM